MASGYSSGHMNPRISTDHNRVGLERRRPLPAKPVGPIAPQSLSKFIESEIIPRLVAAHPVAHAQPPRVAASAIDPSEVAAFAPLAMQVEADELLTHIETLIARGVGVDALLIDLLAPTARTLGEYWKQDRCDFVDVTMALWRLQEVVHELASRIPADRVPQRGAPSALFAPVPGDDHSFGTAVVEEWFARNGWRTDRIGDPSDTALSDRVSSSWFDLVGLTASCDCHIGTLPPVITALRSVSRNPRLCVMVGGPVFVDDPQLAEAVGADGTARDARAALEAAEALLGATARAALQSG